MQRAHDTRRWIDRATQKDPCHIRARCVRCPACPPYVSSWSMTQKLRPRSVFDVRVRLASAPRGTETEYSDVNEDVTREKRQERGADPRC